MSLVRVLLLVPFLLACEPAGVEGGVDQSIGSESDGGERDAGGFDLATACPSAVPAHLSDCTEHTGQFSTRAEACVYGTTACPIDCLCVGLDGHGNKWRCPSPVGPTCPSAPFVWSRHLPARSTRDGERLRSRDGEQLRLLREKPLLWRLRVRQRKQDVDVSQVDV